MKCFASLTFLMVVPFLACAADDKPTNLDGEYQVTSFSKGKTKGPDEFLKKFEGVKIKGEKFTITLDGKPSVWTLKLDTSTKPASIDVTTDDGMNQRGIWKLEKGVLTLALVDGKDAKRPANFEDKGDEVFTLELTVQPKK